MKNNLTFEEIKNILKSIEKENNHKNLLLMGIGIAAIFAALIFLIIKIKEKSERKMVFGGYGGYDYDGYDDSDDFDYEDYDDMDDDYDQSFSIFDSLDEESDEEYSPYDLGD